MGVPLARVRTFMERRFGPFDSSYCAAHDHSLYPGAICDRGDDPPCLECMTTYLIAGEPLGTIVPDPRGTGAPTSAMRAAHAAVSRAIARGDLVRPATCARCEMPPKTGRLIEAHHADYSKPLEVEWLCKSCHDDERRTAR